MGQKTRAVRLYGADDLRLEEFDLPEIRDDEILVKVVSDSICMSTYKLLKQGKKHKRCPQNVESEPIIIGHEFAGNIVKAGAKWRNQYKPGEKFALQPALNYKGSLASPGYSYQFFGGDATYCIIPREAVELGCLLRYDGEAYFYASLAEPVSCIIGGYCMMYHTNKQNYDHAMGIKPGGNTLILGGAGPMGLGAVEYPLCGDVRPSLIAVTDTDSGRLRRAERLIPPSAAEKQGVKLRYVNPRDCPDQYAFLMDLTGGAGYDDVFVYAPIRELAELGDKLMGFDGCLNFFAGPEDRNFSALMNLYNCHYSSVHILGSTGGNTEDLKEALKLSAEKKLRPAVMVTHICGLNAVASAVANLPKLRAGKIVAYTHIDMPLTALADFQELGEKNSLFAELHKSCEAHQGLWNPEAERLLLKRLAAET